jgi:xanthine/uracil/vitamin C permease (AzgA family)
MMAMVVVTALNIALRKRAIAIACGALCVLFVAAVLLAASAGAEHGAANRLAAIVRAVLFFVLIGVACLLQALPARASVGSDAPVGG